MKAIGLVVNFFIFSSSFVFAAATGSQDKAKVIIQEVKLADDQKRILVPAKIDAKIQSVVSADIEAYVVRIVKPLGSEVKAGETVMFLENKDPGFTFAKVPVRSPISGVISQLMTAEMSKVIRGDKLFSVINPKTLKIYAEFSGTDVDLIKIGSMGTFKLNGASRPVRVAGVSPLIDARTGTASAELEFTATDGVLPFIGSIGQVSFEIVQGQVMLIPESALTYNEGKPLLRIVKENNQVEKRAIELGEQRENLFIVKSGLQSGQRIIVRASRPVKEGEIIEVEGAGKN